MGAEVAKRATPLSNPPPQGGREQAEDAGRLSTQEGKPPIAGRARGNVPLPVYSRGMRIGLFGGTFDPPHDAHLAACLIAMKRLRLDRVWWLVTPGNPLKDTRGLAPLAERMAAARVL